MYEKPLVSIIMPVYMVEKFIESSIKSVIKQTYTNIELILVNDGTLDDSIEIAVRTLTCYKTNYIIVNQKNRGQGEARNSGIDIAKGEWICFLDSDDLLAYNAIEHLLKCGIENEADLVFSGFNEIYSSHDALTLCEHGKATCFSDKEIQKCFLLRTNVVLAPGTLYRKRVLDDNKLRFENIPWSEDQHFVWRILYHINKVVYLDEPLYQYLRHSGSIMDATKIDAMIDSYSKICMLKSYYQNKTDIGKYIVSRWVMGTLNAATTIVEYQDWKILASKIKIRREFVTLLSFPEIKVKLMAFLGLCSPILYYYVNQIRKQRG